MFYLWNMIKSVRHHTDIQAHKQRKIVANIFLVFRPYPLQQPNVIRQIATDPRYTTALKPVNLREAEAGLAEIEANPVLLPKYGVSTSLC